MKYIDKVLKGALIIFLYTCFALFAIMLCGVDTVEIYTEPYGFTYTKNGEVYSVEYTPQGLRIMFIPENASGFVDTIIH